MTDAERQEVRAVARQAVVELLAEILVGAVKSNGAPGAPTVAIQETPGSTVDALLGRIADAKAEALAAIELEEREGLNRPEVFRALGARMEALRGAAG